MATREEMAALQKALEWANKPKATKKTVARDTYSRRASREHEKEKKGRK
jgi:hypothetical protein